MADEAERPRPRTEEPSRPRPEPMEETVRPRPAPRPRPVDLAGEEEIAPEPPVRERRPSQPVPLEEPAEEYPLFESPPAQAEASVPRKTRTPKVQPEPAPEPAAPSFISPEPEPEPAVEKPAAEKRRSKTPSASPATAVPVRKPAAPVAPSSGDAATVSQVTKTYGPGGQVQALRDVSLAVPQGRLTAIMGRSGAGKSTLLYCLAGLEVPTSGTVTVAGQTLTDMKERQLDKFRRDSIGLVLRAFNLLPALSVADNIRLPLSIKKEPVDQGWYDQVVETTELTDLLAKKPDELTVGEQQRVALARALVTKPSLIIADEPTGNLDSQTAGQMLAVLRNCVTNLGETVVLATHDAACAANADQVWILDDGAVVEQIKSPTLARVIDALRSVSGGSAA